MKYIAVSGRLGMELDEGAGLLRASLLHRLGLFSAPVGNLIEIEVGQATLQVRVAVAGEVVSIWPKPYETGFAFRFVKVQAPRGARYRFICPRSGKHVDKLLVHGGDVGTKYSFGFNIVERPRRGDKQAATPLEAAQARLIGSDGRWPAWGKERKRLLQLHDLIIDSNGQYVKRSDLAAAVKKQEADDREDHSAREPRIAFAQGDERLEKEAESCEGGYPDLTELAERLASTTDFAMLPIDAILRTWREVPTVSLILTWTGCEIERAIALRIGEDQILIRHQHQAGTRETIILLRKGAQKHPKTYMICPITEALASRFYYRSGRFASARAQKLRYPSQLYG